MKKLYTSFFQSKANQSKVNSVGISPSLLGRVGVGLFFFFSFLFLNKESEAQWVNIPDANFVTWLNSNGFSSAMSGSMMDTTNNIVISTKTILFSSFNQITDLTGIQFFDSLTDLNINYNQINNLPALPARLKSLNCKTNALATLPALPNSLRYLDCGLNSLTTLPTLPDSLKILDCSGNYFSTLPTLPDSLRVLVCHGSQLTVLPALPDSLYYLNCFSNLLTSLPTLPPRLSYLNCVLNQITVLPTLPTSLEILECYNNSLLTLPSSLPASLVNLQCDHNPNLNCLPDLKNVSILSIGSTGITCIPNRGNLDTSWLSFPICATGNPNSCQVYCNSYYSTTYDTLLNTFILTVDTAASNLALSYHWDFGDGTTSTLAAPSHVYTVDTVYNVCLQIHNMAGDSCTYCHTIGKDYMGNIIKSGGFSLNVHNGATGVNDPSTTLKVTEKFEIYPNPADESVVISQLSLGNTIQYYDIFGREILHSTIVNRKSEIVNISSLPNGIYFVKVTDAAGNCGMKKLVIEK